MSNTKRATEKKLQREIEELRDRLAEAEETIRAIREGEVDAVIVSGTKGEQIFSLVGSDSVYRLIVETMQGAAFTLTFDGQILYCNAQFGQLVQYPMEQIVGHSLREFIAESGRADASAFLLAAQQQPIRKRLVLRAGDGSPVPVLAATNILHQPDGSSICVVANDLSELENSTEIIQQLRRQEDELRKNAEALRESEERYRQLVQYAPTGIYELDFVTGRFIEVNDAMCRILGYTKDELLSMSAIDILDDEGKARITARMRDASAGKQLEEDVEYRVRKKDGSLIWGYLNTRFHWEGGKIVRATVVAHDVTARKQAEDALRESEERFRSVLDSSNDVIYRINVQTGRYEYISPSAEEVMGYTPAEIMAWGSDAAFDNIHPDDRPAIMAALADTGTKDMEYRWRDKTGSCRWISNHLSIIVDNSGKMLYRNGNIRDITALKQAEDALRESEKRLTQAQRVAHIGSWEWNIQTGEVQWSAELFAIYGVDPNTFIPTIRSFGEYIHPDDRERVDRHIERIISEGTAVNFDFRIIAADGSIHILNTTGEITAYDENGKPRLMVGSNQDITERKKVEEELRESQERYKAIIETQSEFVARYKTGGVITLVNSSLCQFFNCTPEDFIGRSFLEYIHADERERVASGVASLTTEHPTYIAEARVILPDGCVTIQNWTHRALFDAYGNIVEYQCNGRDMTELRRAEKILRDSESQFRLLFEGNPNPMFVFDEETLRFIAVNDAALSHYGYTRDEFIALNALDIRPSEDRDLARSIIARQNGAQELNAGLHRHVKKDGSVIDVQITVSSILFGGRPARIVLVNDVTELKRIEAELRGLNEVLETRIADRTRDLELSNMQLHNELVDRRIAEEKAAVLQQSLFHAEKLKSLGTLVAGIAHEINNPNQYITTSLTLLSESWKSIQPILDEYHRTNGDFLIGGLHFSTGVQKTHEMFANVVHSAQKIKAIVESLKGYSRKEAPLFTDQVDVNAAIKNVLLILAGKIKSAGYAVVEFGEVPLFKGNKHEIEQVMLNLISNAFDALTDARQRVFITSKYDDAGQVCVRVRDEGAGIDQAEIGNLMTPFFTTKRERGGSGLGLFVCSNIVKAHNGTISFASEKGIGTTVSVIIPVHSAGDEGR